ncbi:MAG: AraC family transcriptional regulator [Oscillospiraceae bacterium]|nr:AraC family transcriptional regulator [Oscillospiraceae bacterium]
MDVDHILYLCEKIAGVFFIPVRLYDEARHIRSFGLMNTTVDPVLPYEEGLIQNESTVSYCLTPFSQHYGAIAHERYSIILGPVGRNEYTTQEKRDYAFALGIDQAAFERLYKQMLAIPSFSVPNFLHILLLMNFCLNRDMLYLDDIAALSQLPEDSIPLDFREIQLKSPEESSVPIHSHMPFERRMLAFVRMGDVAGLKQLFKTYTHGTTGMLAANRLRHLQNFFVTAVTLVSRAAIEGGLFEEEALRLCEKYILQSEGLFKAEAVIDLLDRMVIDYTKRVADLENAKQLSPLISSVVSYIKQNISSPLDVQTLAGQFHISRKTLTSKFKAEMGKTVADFISGERIRRAERLLIHTDKSLTEIADYLGYASQSHFQTRFKATKNQTPLEFRKGNSKFPLIKEDV